jgi:hypothetical protein
VPDVVRACLAALGTQLLSLKKQILELDRMIMAWHRSNETSRRQLSWSKHAPFDAFLEPGRRMRFNRLERREFITLLGGATVGLLGAFALPPGEVIERAVFSCSVEHPRRD